MRVDEYLRHDAVGLAELVRAGEVTSTELLDVAIERAEQVNPALNAIILPMYEEARRLAATAPEGLLCGVPFLLKEIGRAHV